MLSNGPAIDISSLLGRVADALDIDVALAQLQLIDGGKIAEIERRGAFAAGQFTGTVLKPMLILNLGDSDAQACVARFLIRHVPPTHRLTVFDADTSTPPRACLPAELVTSRRGIVAIYVPAADESDANADPRRIQQIVARLRASDGCPWDREQTHQSLRDAIIDEAYEVTDAIDAGDPGNLAEELGDLLLLITMHAQIAAETGAFTIEDVQDSIATKIVGRHPHVFGDEVAETDADLSRIWREAKAREHAARPGKGGGKDLDGEPHSMPALTRANRVLHKYPLSKIPSRSTLEQRAERLLRAVAEIIAAGDDPDAVLRAALTKHIMTKPAPDLSPMRTPDAQSPTPRK